MSKTTTPSRPAAPPQALLWLALVVCGLGWGTTGPLAKIAVSTGNHPIGISFWNTLIGTIVLTIVIRATGRRLPLDRRHAVFFVVCGLLGTALPNVASYTAYQVLPVGVMAIILSLVPMATLLLALPFGLDRPDPRRLLGLGLGVLAIGLIVLPESSLPDPSLAIWVILPVIVSLSYAAENIYIAVARPPGADAPTIMCGLFWGALVLITPAMLATGAWFDLTRLGPAEQATVGISALHILAYLTFVWLIGHAGPVFAAQVAYVVTGSNMVLGILILGERHSPWVWAALGLMLVGLALVKPQR